MSLHVCPSAFLNYSMTTRLVHILSRLKKRKSGVSMQFKDLQGEWHTVRELILRTS